MNEQMSDVVTETRVVELQDAARVNALVEVGVGELHVSGGAEDGYALDAEFTYNIPEWRPEVTYAVEEDCGKLRVKQPHFQGKSLYQDAKYAWNLRFNPKIPLALDVKVGSGKADLDLEGLNLTRLNAKVGSGSIVADVSGDAPNLTAVNVATASGKTALNMRGKYAELNDVVLQTASGRLDMALSGQYPELEKVAVRSASGKMKVSFAGEYAALEALTVETVSGTIDLNLDADWEADLDASLHCFSGVVTVYLPDRVGVAVRVTKVTGRVHAPGFRREGKLYVNDAYGKAEVTLNLAISTVSGAVNLQLGQTEFRNEERAFQVRCNSSI